MISSSTDAGRTPDEEARILEEFALKLRQRWCKRAEGEPPLDCDADVLPDPTFADPPIFSVNVKPGHEQDIVFSLMRGSAADAFPFRGLISAFAVPRKAVGKVYIEATCGDAVRKACTGLCFVYPRSMTVVPLDDRVKLLSPSLSRKPLTVGSWVQIRHGRYRQDFARVHSIDDNQEYVTVEAVPRIDLRILKGKRKRGEFRPAPHLYTRKEVEEQTSITDSEGNTIEVRVRSCRDGFQYGDLTFTDTGYVLLRRHFTSFVAAVPTAKDIQVFLNEDLDRFMTEQVKAGGTLSLDEDLMRFAKVDLNSVYVPRVLRRGQAVVILSGECVGRQGLIVDTSIADTVVVELDDDGGSLTVQILAASVRRIFNVGQHVQAIGGVEEGRRGLVEDIEGDIIMIREDETFDQVSSSYHPFYLLSTFFDRYACLPSTATTTQRTGWS